MKDRIPEGFYRELRENSAILQRWKMAKGSHRLQPNRCGYGGWGAEGGTALPAPTAFAHLNLLPRGAHAVVYACQC